MEFDFFLLTTFLWEKQNNSDQIHVRCLGCREILRLETDAPRHILGKIEFESSHIPILDLGAASGFEPIKVDHSNCILIVQQDYESRKIHTGIVVQDFEDIEKLAAGIYKIGSESDAGENVRLILEMYNGHIVVNEILIESHRVLSMLDKTEAKDTLKYLKPRPGKLFNLIEKLRSLDLPKRHIVLEELASKPELWDKEHNVMVL